jgi:hypothetical protein
MSDESKKLQVQIRVWGTDGEWFVPAYQPAAVLMALQAIRLDIQELPGSYPQDKLCRILGEAQQLSTLVAELAGSELAGKQAPSGGTVVIQLANTQVLLTDQGFYARCERCPWVTDIVHGKYQARQAAKSHEEG